MKILRTLLICSSAVFFMSCTRFLPPFISVAHFSSPVKQSFKVDTNSAVVYGRFATGPDFAFGNELALRLCQDSSKRVYLIRCVDKDSVSAIAIEPGRYRIAGFVATFLDHRPVGRRHFPATRLFQVRSNSATYLGDFTGYAKIGPMTQEWGVRGIRNNFTATTDEFRRKYPNLASVPRFSAFDQQPTEPLRPGDYTRTLTVQKMQRTYLVHAPDHGSDYRVEMVIASLYWTDASVGRLQQQRGWGW